MKRDNLIPTVDVDSISNPMIWEDEEPAEGVFVGTSADDALALLGVPSLELPPAPRLPDDFVPSQQLRDWLDRLGQGLAQIAQGLEGQCRLPLTKLAAVDVQAIEEILGAGEVSGHVTLDGVRYELAESVLAGVWRINGDDGSQWVEVATAPSVALDAGAALEPANYAIPAPTGEVMNAAAVLAEISERALAWQECDAANHVLNFTLLPMNEADHAMLTAVLGRADFELTSGGFGDCRIMATRYRHVWAVQFVNAMGHTILDTIEIGELPAAARAAGEDFEDSADRLTELLEAYL